MTRVLRLLAPAGFVFVLMFALIALARTAGAARDRLVSRGRYALKGVGRAQELYTIDPQMLGPD